MLNLARAAAGWITWPAPDGQAPLGKPAAGGRSAREPDKPGPPRTRDREKALSGRSRGPATRAPGITGAARTWRNVREGFAGTPGNGTLQRRETGRCGVLMTRRVTWTSATTRHERGSIGAEKTIRNRKVTPMLPEPTLAKPPATAAVSRSWVMTPLFCVPDICDPGTLPSHPPGYRSTSQARRSTRRPNPAVRGRGNRGRTTVKTAPRKDTSELLLVNDEWLRRALSRSFLRYNVAGDLDGAVHAAMNVIEPVLQARDIEIVRLRELIPVKAPGR